MGINTRLDKLENIVTAKERMPFVVIAHPGEVEAKIAELREKYNDYETKVAFVLPPKARLPE